MSRQPRPCRRCDLGIRCRTVISGADGGTDHGSDGRPIPPTDAISRLPPSTEPNAGIPLRSTASGPYRRGRGHRRHVDRQKGRPGGRSERKPRIR
ncbi:hypothetical protein GS506_02165 [Rhodococcus hoagii]|nr:hypothetical protein [Prescottella equi]